MKVCQAYKTKASVKRIDVDYDLFTKDKISFKVNPKSKEGVK